MSHDTDYYQTRIELVINSAKGLCVSVVVPLINIYRNLNNLTKKFRLLIKIVLNNSYCAHFFTRPN